jgi:8-oxo-dGTP pyrophosphatase MutT (NUDIX family)
VVVRDGRLLVIRRRYGGRDYAVLPGGSVEPGETFEEAAVRELREEATMTSRVDRLLLTDEHTAGREARYFVMADVEGEPVLGGPELEAHGPENSFDLRWASADDLVPLGLQPEHHRTDLPRVLDLGCGSPVVEVREQPASEPAVRQAVARCRVTMPPLRFSHSGRCQPACPIRSASRSWSGHARIDSAR